MSRGCISCGNFAGRRRPIWCQFKGQFPVLPPIPLSHGCEILRRMVPPSRQTVIGLDIGTREYIETTKVLTAPRPRPAWASPVYRVIKFEFFQNDWSESELERIIMHVISNSHACAERGALARECSSSSSSSDYQKSREVVWILCALSHRMRKMPSLIGACFRTEFGRCQT